MPRREAPRACPKAPARGPARGGIRCQGSFSFCFFSPARPALRLLPRLPARPALQGAGHKSPRRPQSPRRIFRPRRPLPAPARPHSTARPVPRSPPARPARCPARSHTPARRYQILRIRGIPLHRPDIRPRTPSLPGNPPARRNSPPSPAGILFPPFPARRSPPAPCPGTPRECSRARSPARRSSGERRLYRVLP